MSVQGMPLPAGVTVGDYLIQGVLDHDRYVFRYRAEHPEHGSVVLHELFAGEFARRGGDGIEVEPLDPEDRLALRWWTRNYLERGRQFAAIGHPALLPIHAVFESHGTACHATPALTVPSLGSLLADGAPLDEVRLHRLLAGLLAALAAVHEARLLHRALCLQQIWLHDDGGCVVGGFGSLRAPLRFRSRMLQTVMPAAYAAPEESRPDATLTPAADLYAAAAIAYHAIGGRAPPSADARLRGAELPPLSSLAGGRVPAPTLAALERALSLDAHARPQTVDQWSVLLRTPATVRPVVETQAVPDVPQASLRRRRGWLLAGVPAVLALGLAGGWLLRPAAVAPGVTPPPVVARAAGEPVRGSADGGDSRPAEAGLPATDSTDTSEPAAVAAMPGESDGGTVMQAATAQAAENKVAAMTAAALERAAVATPQPTVAPTAVPTVAPRQIVLAPTPAPVQATPAARPAAPSAESERAAGVDVASLGRPSIELTPADPAAEARAAEEQRRRAHAQQLALERSRCSRNGHISDLIAGRDFTYDDIAKFQDVRKLPDGQLQTPLMKVDDGRRYAFLLDSNGCIVRVLR